ncbi:hypothetical protein CWI38_0225p0010 [Hamiltosporidium tvaerminnensis]|uniref:Uncharacterized protein n=1 Tax=Hamiltosporidium tvaerminnensis TaxID=1176355 RepID=A0A4Q9M0I3_9MICR|nr:hypothetical protein CWI38_0225p0010 [Hamiltosporidium tvaerminnensis]
MDALEGEKLCKKLEEVNKNIISELDIRNNKLKKAINCNTQLEKKLKMYEKLFLEISKKK